MDIKERSSSSDHLESEHSKEEELECAVCLQTCVHPVRLPCSHIFCFLCVKGVANQSKRCAMCRQEIPADFLDNPTLLKKIEEKETDTEGYQWFYEGRNGWWQYDERTSLDLETAYGGGHRLFEVLVAGFLYTVDFDRMVQQRRNDPSRRRRIKRDLGTIPKKGVAGLKTVVAGDETTEELLDEGGEAGDEEEEEGEEEGCSHAANSSPGVSVPLCVESHVSLPPLADERGASPFDNGLAPADLPPTTTTFRPSSPSSLPVSSELESLHLLHSELQRSLYRDFRGFPAVRRRPIPVALPTTPPRNGVPSTGTKNGVPSTGARNLASHYSPYVRLQHFFNDSDSRPNNGSNNTSQTLDNQDVVSSRDAEETGSVDAITSHIRNLALEPEAEESEYYSLDGTEEYNLPNDNEKL